MNPNKERLFPEIRNKVGLLLILKKVFRSDNILHRINQLSTFFAANYPGKISEQFFKPYAELLLHFPQIVSKLGWLHEHKYLPNTRKIFYHKATCTQLTCHRYDSSSLIACFVAESCANINLPIPTVTFDQLLCIKTYEIVSTKNMKISV